MNHFTLIITKGSGPEDIEDLNILELVYSKSFSANKSYQEIIDIIDETKINWLGEWINTDIVQSDDQLTIYLHLYGINREYSKLTDYLESQFNISTVSKGKSISDFKEIILLKGNDYNEETFINEAFVKEIKINKFVEITKTESSFEGGASVAFEGFLIGIGSSLAASAILSLINKYRDLREDEDSDDLQFHHLTLTPEIRKAIVNVYGEKADEIFFKSFVINEYNNTVNLEFQSRRYSYNIQLSAQNEILKVETRKLTKKKKGYK